MRFAELRSAGSGHPPQASPARSAISGQPLIDSHAHLDDPAFDADRRDVMARAFAAGVRAVLVPGTREDRWPRLAALASEFGWAWAKGTHPYELLHSRAIPSDPDTACAIGECGLDGGVAVGMEEQERVLSGHLALARDAGLPVILHCFRAHDRLLPLLRRFGSVRGVLHSYSGGPDLVPAYLNAGLHLSFTGILCNPRARKPHAALRLVPRERLLLETDAPDQAPGGGRNEPSRVMGVLAAAETLRGELLHDAVVSNAKHLGIYRECVVGIRQPESLAER